MDFDSGFRLGLNLLGLAGALALSFISSGMETALYRISRVRTRVRADQGEARARFALRMLDTLDSMVTAILIDNNIAAYLATYLLTAQFALWAVPQMELLTTAVITPVFFVFTESLPKQLAYNNADRWTFALVRVFEVFRHTLAPAVWILNKTSAGLRRLLGARGEANLSHSQRTMLLEQLSAGVADNVLSSEQNYMAERIMQLEGISAGDSMIPLRRLLLLPRSAERSRVVAELSRRKARFALLFDLGGKPTDQVITMDKLIMSPGRPDDPVAPLAEHLEKIRSGDAIPEVLNLFRTKHARHALIMDRGRVTGIITTQSVLDRIAGISR